MMRYGLLLFVVLFGFGCGPDKENKRKPVRGTSQDENIVKPFNPDEDYVVRGRILLKFGNAEELSGFTTSQFLMGSASGNAAMSASVAANVRFNLDTANFVEPVDPEDGEIPYGTLDIDRLRDNELRVCGPANDEKCTLGVIRTYTTGTPGPGLWNAVEGYGLPIKSGADEVGLDPAGAVNLAEVAIAANKRVFRLQDLTGGGGSYQIPIAVDFTEAAAGAYSSTIVIEYLVQ